MADQIKVVFDTERSLVVRHQFIRDAVLRSTKSVGELITDPFGGWPYLIQALVNGKTVQANHINLDKASQLIDAYREKNKSIKGLSDILAKLLSDYVGFEQTPTEDEEEDSPNATTPVAPGPSAD